MDFIEDKFRDELAADKGEQYLLYGLVRAIRPSVCLEVGTHKGTSTWYIAKALEDNEKGYLITVDPFDYENTKNRLSAYPRTEYRQLRGDEVQIGEKIDFVFLDGLHDLETVDKELYNILPQLNKDAIIAFHDAQDEPTNHSDGVQAAIKKHKLVTTYLPSVYGMTLCRHK